LPREDVDLRRGLAFVRLGAERLRDLVAFRAGFFLAARMTFFFSRRAGADLTTRLTAFFAAGARRQVLGSISPLRSRGMAKQAVQLRRALFIISLTTTGTRASAHRVLRMSHRGTPFSAIPRRELQPIDMREMFHAGSQACRRLERSPDRVDIVRDVSGCLSN